jgi:hypothetical protein
LARLCGGAKTALAVSRHVPPVILEPPASTVCDLNCFGLAILK